MLEHCQNVQQSDASSGSDSSYHWTPEVRTAFITAADTCYTRHLYGADCLMLDRHIETASSHMQASTMS